MFDNLGQIEIKDRVVLSIKHVEADGVAPDFIDHLTQGDEFPSAFRHFNWFAGAQQPDQLHELYIKVSWSCAQRFDRRLHAPDIAAVVSAPDVDQVPKTAVQFRLVIGNVSGEVRIGPVGFL